MRIRPPVIVAGTLAAVALLAVVVTAASGTGLSLVWRLIAGGGGRASSSGYVLDGSIGQSLSGDLASADYRLGAGYWSGMGEGSPAPTATSSLTPTLMPTSTSSLTATSMPIATPSATPVNTPSPTFQITATSSATPTATVSPSASQRVYLPVVRKS